MRLRGAQGRDVGPCGGCKVLGYSTGGYRIPGCPPEACVLTWVHSEYLAALLFYQAPLIATLVSLPVTFKMAQYMSLQNVHVTSRNLKDKRHTVAVLGADPDHLVLYSFSLCSFILPQNIHKANTLTVCIISLDSCVAVSLIFVA